MAIVIALITMGAGMGGCSFDLSSAFDKPRQDDIADVTGTTASALRLNDETSLSESDLALARNAASDVLTRGGKDASQPWENPKTGARGSVTPLAIKATSEDGRVCRDFLASYVSGTKEGWLQGEACQSGRGPWEIRSMKPWKRS